MFWFETDGIVGVCFTSSFPLETVNLVMPKFGAAK